MKLRVLIISPTYLPTIGGTEIYLRRFSRELANRGFRVTILTPWISGTKLYEVSDAVNIKRVPLRKSFKSPEVLLPLLPRMFSRSPKSFVKLLVLLSILGIASVFGVLIRKKELVLPIYWYSVLLREIFYDKSDIIHAFYLVNSGFISCIMGKILKKKVVVDELSNPYKLYEATNSGFRSKIIRYVLKNADFVFVGSRKLLRILDKFEVNPNKIKVRYMPIDTNQFKPINDKIQKKREMGLEDKFVLLYVGRLVSYKNIQALIEAIPLIKEKIPNSILLIVGGGHCREFLEEKVKLLNVSKYVNFCGLVQPEEVHKYYQVGDVFVSLSKQPQLGRYLPHPDAVILEAMASGLPIVSTPDLQLAHNYDVRDVKTFKIIRTGVIVNPENISNFVDAINLLYLDRTLRSNIAKECRKIAINFSWKQHMSEVIDLYYSLVRT